MFPRLSHLRLHKLHSPDSLRRCLPLKGYQMFAPMSLRLAKLSIASTAECLLAVSLRASCALEKVKAYEYLVEEVAHGAISDSEPHRNANINASLDSATELEGAGLTRSECSYR